jgi:hypothetical protein
VTQALTIARRGIGADDVIAKGGRDLVTGFSVIGEERGGAMQVCKIGS